MMIINVRGTNGSGKSTIVRKLLDGYPHKSIYGVLGPRNPEAYELKIPNKQKLPVFLLGPYQTEMGGADCIQPYDNIIPLIEKYAARGHVLFEGVLVSKSKGSVGTYLEKYGKQTVLIFLDTPMDVCIASVEKRRQTRGDARALNPRNLIEAYKGVQRVRKTLLGEGILRIEDVTRDACPEFILKLLAEKV